MPFKGSLHPINSMLGSSLVFEMRPQVLSLNILFILLYTTSTQHVHYVKPSDNYSLSCPGQPCLTLGQYTRQASEYFITGATFEFLAGHHSIRNTINLHSISNITFKGKVKNFNTYRVSCVNGGTIWCNNVTNLIVEGLMFLLNPNATLFQISDGSMILVYSTAFQGKENNSRAISITHSSALTVESCLFEMNSAISGGAIYALGSNVTITSSVFNANRARDNGGAIFANTSMLVVKDSAFSHNRAGSNGGAVAARNSIISVSGSNISWTTVLQHMHDEQRNRSKTQAASTVDSLITTGLNLSGIVCFYNNKVHSKGGAVHILNSTVTFGGSVVFKNNSAGGGGGALNLNTVNMSAQYMIFADNSASGGGAIYAARSSLRLGAMVRGATMSGTSLFYRNKSSSGGALLLNYSVDLILSGYSMFLKNEAHYNGGAVYMGVSNTLSLLKETVTILEQNSAARGGGGIYSKGSIIATGELLLHFIGNIAGERGGGLHVNRDIHTWEKLATLLISAKFTKNTAATCGGAVYVAAGMNVQFENITAIFNSGSALCILEDTSIKFIGSTNINSNTGRTGGGIRIPSGKSDVSFSGHTVFETNRADVGGAIYSLYETSLTFTGITIFGFNTADADGGALYALGTNITFRGSKNITQSSVAFVYNSAENGGAMYLNSASSWTLKTSAHIAYNHAMRNGGVIFHEDTALTTQCNYKGSSEISTLPFCFIRIDSQFIPTLTLNKNSAGREGNFLHGGLLDRCQRQHSDLPFELFSTLVDDRPTNVITSQPYQLCFCENDAVYDCSGLKNIEIYRGQKFYLSLLALDQMRTPTSTQIYSKVNSTARFQMNHRSQKYLLANCTVLSYNLYSTEDSEELILYPDGPCRDTGVARAIINATFLPCPDGFSKSGEKCVCEERLQHYGANCTIDDDDVIIKGTDSKFWMNASYENETYKGLILCETCPVEYCKIETIAVSLDNPDIQCANNRSGILCGACAANYSLMLGSSRCEECSNTYLALLPLFAAAGIALVVFLSVLRLTVATGMINSVVLYANIIQANRHQFFEHDTVNVLTTFIAWLNLDFGFRTCFYHHMDAYSQTWLQLVFPIFVWSLICLIIISSRYSILISKLIGHNPIAVLATLLLMSYMKILKIVVIVYSSVTIDYPNNRTVTVWLNDGNVLYLRSKHLLLTVVTSLVLVFLFLPYTLLLLLGYKLHRFSGRKYLCWMTRLKPLLDSYYAPYKIHTRYWTGFLLLVRCALYIVFSYNSLGATSMSLLAIITVFTVIGFGIGLILQGRIYINVYTNFIEMSMYLNLVLISGITLTEYNSPELVYSLIGIAFATMIGIIVYHFHITYTAKSAMWLKFKTKMSTFMATLNGSKNTASSVDNDPPWPSRTSSHDPDKIVTKTVIELREPLLESN